MKLSMLSKVVFSATEFTHLTGLIFLAHALVCIATFAILGASPYINLSSLGLVVLMDIAFFLALRHSSDKNAAHMLIFAWYVLFFFNVRIASLLLLPPEALEFPAHEAGNYFSDAEFLDGLVFVISGIIAILAGISIAGNFKSKQIPTSASNGAQFSLWAITAYWLVTYAAAYYVTVHLGVTIFGGPENWGNRMAWVRIIFDTDVALMFTIVWALVQWHYHDFTKLQRLHVVLLVLMWLVFSVIIGSRGGPLRILIFLFIATLAVKPKFKLSVTGFAALVGILLLVNSYIFAVGTAFRHASIEGVSISQSMSDYDSRHLEFKPIFFTEEQTGISDLRRQFYQSSWVQSVAMKLRPTVTRLAIIDYPIVVVVNEPNMAVIDHYIKSAHPIKNFLNSMVPSEIFDEAMINTSRVFGMAYGGKTLEDISEGYMSEPFTIWGEAWLLAGFFAGVCLLFLVALLIQAGFNLMDKNQSMERACLRFVYIMTVALGIYGMFGIDYWLTSVAHFSLASFIAYTFIRILSLWKWRV